ncbi:hypothetical protein FJT64_009492 [Amphibalanus amphitrite]|uniref:Uncharacterized protein n=1 Tax=Amphibalanus amphitrite TaxID=1232801 RepID=A0A6A4VTA2_AMPAM|nr:hypothetical protein FJT64_009492 [Amphibalanus amphitrite]
MDSPWWLVNEYGTSLPSSIITINVTDQHGVSYRGPNATEYTNVTTAALPAQAGQTDAKLSVQEAPKLYNLGVTECCPRPQRQHADRAYSVSGLVSGRAVAPLFRRCSIGYAKEIVDCFEEGKSRAAGPFLNVRVESVSSNAFRVRWDEPDKKRRQKSRSTGEAGRI